MATTPKVTGRSRRRCRLLRRRATMSIGVQRDTREPTEDAEPFGATLRRTAGASTVVAAMVGKSAGSLFLAAGDFHPCTILEPVGWLGYPSNSSGGLRRAAIG